LAEKRSITIDEKHWRRSEAAAALNAQNVVPKDLSQLHRLLYEERKAMFYEGFDGERAARHPSAELTAITEEVQSRAKVAGVAAIVLSGSTARGHQTEVSDLDYHVIGSGSLCVDDLPAEVDLYVDDIERFWTKLRNGDDFAHWSVWYGCVLFDSGVMREAARWIADNDAWPDAGRKLRQARGALAFAEQMVASGDYGASLEQA
jgi:predicted nucleotidyltransferase